MLAALSCRSLAVPDDINPVTGAAWEQPAAQEMSPEERERSAEELMDLIDRLNSNGILKLQLGRQPPK